MTSHGTGSARIFGSLRAADGTGTVRMQDRFATDIDDLWSTLTEPDRLDRWLGTFSGDLRPGGEFHARYHSSGWEGNGRIDECEAPRRLRVITRADDATTDVVIEVTLTADGDHTVLVSEHHGLPVDKLPGYGAGIQIHLEDLGSYLTGGARCDSDARMSDLYPLFQHISVDHG